VVSGQQHAPAALHPRERTGTHCTGGWVGPRAGLDGRKISSLPGFDPGPSSPWLYRNNSLKYVRNTSIVHKNCHVSLMFNQHFRTPWLLQHRSNTVINAEMLFVTQFVNSIDGLVFATQKKCLPWGRNKYLSLCYKKFRLQRLRNVSFVALQSTGGQRLLIIVAARSHSDTTQSVGLLSMNQPHAQTHNRQTSRWKRLGVTFLCTLSVLKTN